MYPSLDESSSVPGPSGIGVQHHFQWPLIGATSQVIRISKWYKAAVQLGFDALEINRRNSKLHLGTFHLEKIKRYLQGLHISLHSATTGIFQELESFSCAEMAVLQAEVDVARILGADELIFHINAGRLDVGKRLKLRPIIDYAHTCGILPIYESDAGMNAGQVLKVLDMFPDIGYALDLGHLNNGWGRNLLGCRIDTFIEKIKHRVVYVHANNNDGIKDQHYGLEQGCLDWRSVLDQLDIRQIRKIIIEVCSAEHIADSRRALLNYLDKRSASVTNCWKFGI
ncbi:MAG: TIM barrel protein [Desulfatitalea sp.]